MCRYLYLCCPAWQLVDCASVLVERYVSTLINEDYYYYYLAQRQRAVLLEFFNEVSGSGRDLSASDWRTCVLLTGDDQHWRKHFK